MTDVEIFDLLETVLLSPYANPVSRQFILTAVTKMASRPRTTEPTKQRIGAILKGYETNLDLEIQQRAVEFASLFEQSAIVAGVLEEMPPPEVKSTVVGVGESFTVISIWVAELKSLNSEREQARRITCSCERCKAVQHIFTVY